MTTEDHLTGTAGEFPVSTSTSADHPDDRFADRSIDSFAEIGELLRAPEPCHVRHSKGYAVDVASSSVDHESGLELPGLSVNPMDPEPWWTRPWEDWVARQICQYAHLSDEEGVHSWLLTGRCVGRGPDCEPLLVEVRPYGRLSSSVISEAERRYRQNFAQPRRSPDASDDQELTER